MKQKSEGSMKAEVELTGECWLTLRAVALALFDGDNSAAIEAALKEYFEKHHMSQNS